MDRSASTPPDEASTAADAPELCASATPESAATSPKKRITITFYLTDAMRNRARAAYRQTSYSERDASWSAMINKALLAEVERRELAYNDGEAFVGNDEPLTPGRPIGY